MSNALANVDLSKLSKADLVQVLGQVLANGNAPATDTPAKEEPKTSKQHADALVEESPFTHTTGRVYLSGAMIEAAARVASTGTPELVKVPTENKRTAAVVFWQTDEGSIAAQNLRTA